MDDAVRYVTGTEKALLEARIVGALLARGVAWAGPAAFGRAFRDYLRSPRNLLRGGPGRYVRSRYGEVFAATAMPPLNDPSFPDLVAEEVMAIAEGRPLPLLFGLLSVSSRCPYRCPHCYALPELGPEEAVPLEALVQAVRDLAEAGARAVFFTGGEPLMRVEDLPVLVRTAREAGLRCFLVTTGHRADREVLARLAEGGLAGVIVSLDGRDAATVARSKGNPGAFDVAVSALRAAVQVGLLASVDCMVGPEVLDPEGFDRYLDFVGDLGVHFVNFFPAHPSGGAAVHGRFGLTPAEHARLESLMARNNRGARPRPLAWSAAVWEAPRGCVGGHQFIYVNPLGQVRACPFLPRPVGDIVQGRLRDILATLRTGPAPSGCAPDLVRPSVPAPGDRLPPR